MKKVKVTKSSESEIESDGNENVEMHCVICGVNRCASVFRTFLQQM